MNRIHAKNHENAIPSLDSDLKNRKIAIRRLQSLTQMLRSKTGAGTRTFKVPHFLVEPTGTKKLVDIGSPYTFFVDKILQIIEKSENSLPKPVAQTGGVLYLAFMRSFASLDGRIGTALSQIAFLEFLVSILNVDRFITLPVSTMGRSNKKGVRGSPFAVSDPFSIDPSIADPLLPEMGPIEQYRMLIDACTALGVRAGSVVPLTTLAIDSNLLRQQPGLGYWWQRKPGELLYAVDDKGNELEKAAGGTYAALFCAPPRPEETIWIETPLGPRLSAKDGSTSLVNAFPDPVAGDPATYTWRDVATVRYTDDLVPPSQGALRNVVWDYNLPAFTLMPEVLRWRAEALGERIFIIDVCASLPREILRRARTPGVELVAEQLWDLDARGNELDGIVGPLVFGVGANWQNPDAMTNSLLNCLYEIQRTPPDRFFLAGASNHDTRPTPPKVTAAIWAATWLLPGAVPFIFSGSEHGSDLIVNKEFGFSASEQEDLDEMKLALFNDCPVNWDQLPDDRELFIASRRIYILKILIEQEIGTNPRFNVLPCAKHLVHYQIQSATRLAGRVDVFFNCGRTPQTVRSLEIDIPLLTFGDVEESQIVLNEFVLYPLSTLILSHKYCGINPKLLT